MLAQDDGFFDYHFNGILTVNSSQCNRAFLMKDEDGTLEQALRNSPNLDQEKCKLYSMLMSLFLISDLSGLQR